MAPFKPDRPARTDAAAEFEALLRHHVPALYRLAYRWTGSVDRAEDLVQDLLVRLFPKLTELRRLDDLRSWVVRVMYRIFLDDLRRRRASPVQPAGLDNDREDAEDADACIDQEAEPPAMVERQLTQQRLLAAWQNLAVEHRLVLSMHDIEGYTMEELAGVMEIPLGTVKSRLHRARTRLRQLLAREHFTEADRV